MAKSTLLQKYTAKNELLKEYQKTLDDLKKLPTTTQELDEFSQHSKSEIAIHQKVNWPLSSSQIVLTGSKMDKMLSTHLQKLLILKKAAFYSNSIETIGVVECLSEIETAIDSARGLSMQNHTYTLEETLQLISKCD